MTDRRLDPFPLALLALVGFLLAMSFSGCMNSGNDIGDKEPQEQGVPVYTYEIVNAYPHDNKAFTQGLVFHNGTLYEGTGLLAESSLRRVDPRTGAVMQQYNLTPEYFGEGVAIHGDTIYQITWRNKLAFTYDLETFEPKGEFEYAGEGWGLTTDGEYLIMSNGSPTIAFRDPRTFEVQSVLEVRDNGKAVDNLNELEYINGSIYANIWKEDRIAVISPDTGNVTAWINCTGLLRGELVNGREDVLNGIAYDSDGERLFLTGKLWPYIYEVELRLQ